MRPHCRGRRGSPTQGPCGFGWMASRVCAYLRLALAEVDSHTLAMGRSNRPVMGPVFGQCTTVCSLSGSAPSICIIPRQVLRSAQLCFQCSDHWICKAVLEVRVAVQYDQNPDMFAAARAYVQQVYCYKAGSSLQAFYAGKVSLSCVKGAAPLTWTSAKKRLYRFTRHPVTRPSIVRTTLELPPSAGSAGHPGVANTAPDGASRTRLSSEALLYASPVPDCDSGFIDRLVLCFRVVSP